MAKKLKVKDRWLQFNTAARSSLGFGDVATMGFVSGTGIFRFEFDYIHKIHTSQQWVFFNNTSGATQKGFYIIMQANSCNMQLVITNGAANIMNATRVVGESVKSHIVISGDGVNVTFNVNGVTTTTGFTGLPSVGNAAQNPKFGYGDNTQRLIGKMRNFKIYKSKDRTTPFLWFPMQDSASFGAEILTGLNATNSYGGLTIVDRNEPGDWTLFGKTDGYIRIGTASTLAWMNSGTFFVSFEFQAIDMVNGAYIISTNGAPATYGFRIAFTLATMKCPFVRCNGTAGYAANVQGGTITYGTRYRFTIQGNGTQYRYIQDNLETGVNLYDSGRTAIAYVPQATTLHDLYISAYNGYTSFKIRNVLICTDTAGLVPFMYLPMQRLSDIATDRVTGLVGAYSALTIINDNTNILKDMNTRAYFSGTTHITGLDNDGYSMTDGVNDIPFEVEFDIIFTTIVGQVNRTIGKRAATYERGIDFYQGKLRFMCLNQNGAAYILATSNMTFLINTPYHVKCTYDGSKNTSGLKIYINGSLITSTNTTVGVYTGMVNTTLILRISYPAIGYYLFGYLRNVKITKAGKLISFFPMQDSLRIGTDVVGSLNATAATGVTIVDISQKVLKES